MIRPFYSFFAPTRSVYVVSDSQSEELKRKQHHEDLANIDASRKYVEANYQSQMKILDERENELKRVETIISKRESFFERMTLCKRTFEECYAKGAIYSPLFN